LRYSSGKKPAGRPKKARLCYRGIASAGGKMTESENKTKSKAKSSMIEQQRIKATTSGKPPVYDIIGNRLRDYYDEVAKQPVPDRFMELLMQLEAKTEKKD
jgi:hypothetical protein